MRWTPQENPICNSIVSGSVVAPRVLSHQELAEQTPSDIESVALGVYVGFESSASDLVIGGFGINEQEFM